MVFTGLNISLMMREMPEPNHDIQKRQDASTESFGTPGQWCQGQVSLVGSIQSNSLGLDPPPGSLPTELVAKTRPLGRPHHHWSQMPHLLQFCVNGDILTLCQYVLPSVAEEQCCLLLTSKLHVFEPSNKVVFKKKHNYKQGGVPRKAIGES